MAPILYISPYSQPSRAALMIVKALNINVDIKEIDLLNKQQFSSDYLKLNPQHTVPTLLEEDGFTLWDSHAILPYLVDKYSKDDSLYPKDLRKRALINQRLHFESGVVFPVSMAIIVGLVFIYQGMKIIPQEFIDKLNEVYSFLEKFLEGRNWVAGDNVTVADFSIVTSITSADIVVPIDSRKFPNISNWIKRMEQLPYYGVTVQGLNQMREIIAEKLK